MISEVTQNPHQLQQFVHQDRHQIAKVGDAFCDDDACDYGFQFKRH